MGALVLGAALLALLFPAVLQQVPTKVINYLLGVVMFGMGLTLRLQDFKIVFSRPKDVVIGCLAQFTVMPLLAWALSRLFQLDEALALGVVLVGCCPGGTASNVITYLAKGDLALSVGNVGTLPLLPSTCYAIRASPRAINLRATHWRISCVGRFISSKRLFFLSW